MLTFPNNHQPRYGNFSIKAISDETIREGGERALFGASNPDKVKLVEQITNSGIKDIDVGSGIKEPEFVKMLLSAQDEGKIPEDVTFSFNLTLKTCEPLMAALEKTLSRDLLQRMYVSIGMIEIDSEHHLFERTAERLRKMGVGELRSSLLNAFSSTIDENKYEHLMSQIERCRQQGISLIRINDSVGTLFPEATAVLAANLVADNPGNTFYLHGHNDRGLGTANSLTSVFHGFQMIEGGVAGVGNRAGLAELESIAAIFSDNNITVDSGELNLEGIYDAARMSEKVYLTTPNPYRPMSGFLVRNENAGIVNVPDYLGVSRDVDYFINEIGLFPTYLEQILIENGVPADRVDDKLVNEVYETLSQRMAQLYEDQSKKFEKLYSQIIDFYQPIYRMEDVGKIGMELSNRDTQESEREKQWMF